MNTLPVLLSIPHGGTLIPDEVKNRVGLTPNDLFNDSDAYTFHIYNLGIKAAKIISTDIARAFVDLNRAPDDLPPHNPDGVIKTVTCYNRQIYNDNSAPDSILIHKLLTNYYTPYHENLSASCMNPDISMALDCHSMAAVGPPQSHDTGQTRPMFCLGNRHGQSCSMRSIEKFAECVRVAFSLNSGEVTINTPFPGGYIAKLYGNNPLPWMQIEMNRSMYLTSQWFDKTTLEVDGNRLKDLNQMFEKALRMYFNVNDKSLVPSI